MKRAILLAAFVAAALGTARRAEAFCGFYVAGGDQQMFNDATQVVLMHLGTRTVLSMQNNYKGPPQDFAMVIPVPVVLHEGDVKTLAKETFAHVEQMGAPRLVEYWEQDPCRNDNDRDEDKMAMPASVGRASGEMAKADAKDLGVKIEAKFAVGEYNILILSAKDSTGLNTWLTQEHYQVPAGAEPLLRPYVENGMKFFVAKVDPKKVKFVDGRVALSPLRFHYDSDDFALPIRLGLANSSGKQDLIVNILAPHQRYEVANYKNVFIPTNIDVSEQMKDKFGSFYTALFDRTLEKNPGAVVTEYAWQATTCDPCPGPALDQNDFMTLGADVLAGEKGKPVAYYNEDFVLTRLHARYGKELTDDLRFKNAGPVAGGREHMVKDEVFGADPWANAGKLKLEEGAKPDSENNFQGRYAVRHEWTGEIKCASPVRGRWGGPPGRSPYDLPPPMPALGLAFAARDQVQLAKVVKRDLPEIDVKSDLTPVHAPPAPTPPTVAPVTPVTPITPITPPVQETRTKSGCGCQTGDRSDLGGLIMGLGVLVWARRKRR